MPNEQASFILTEIDDLDSLSRIYRYYRCVERPELSVEISVVRHSCQPAYNRQCAGSLFGYCSRGEHGAEYTLRAFMYGEIVYEVNLCSAVAPDVLAPYLT